MRWRSCPRGWAKLGLAEGVVCLCGDPVCVSAGYSLGVAGTQLWREVAGVRGARAWA